MWLPVKESPNCYNRICTCKDLSVNISNFNTPYNVILQGHRCKTYHQLPWQPHNTSREAASTFIWKAWFQRGREQGLLSGRETLRKTKRERVRCQCRSSCTISFTPGFFFFLKELSLQSWFNGDIDTGARLVLFFTGRNQQGGPLSLRRWFAFSSSGVEPSWGTRNGPTFSSFPYEGFQRPESEQDVQCWR